MDHCWGIFIAAGPVRISFLPSFIALHRPLAVVPSFFCFFLFSFHRVSLFVCFFFFSASASSNRLPAGLGDVTELYRVFYLCCRRFVEVVFFFSLSLTSRNGSLRSFYVGYQLCAPVLHSQSATIRENRRRRSSFVFCFRLVLLFSFRKPPKNKIRPSCCCFLFVVGCDSFFVVFANRFRDSLGILSRDSCKESLRESRREAFFFPALQKEKGFFGVMLRKNGN